MSVNSVKSNRPPSKELPFPKLMESANNECVVHFISYGVGTCVFAGRSSCMGLYSDEWSMSGFTDFHGSITLSNQS